MSGKGVAVPSRSSSVTALVSTSKPLSSRVTSLATSRSRFFRWSFERAFSSSDSVSAANPTTT